MALDLRKSSLTVSDFMKSSYMAHPPKVEDIEYVGEEKYGSCQTVVLVRCVALSRLPRTVLACEDGICVTITSGGSSFTLPSQFPSEEMTIRDPVLNAQMPRGLVRTYAVCWNNVAIMLPGAPYHGNGPEYLAFPFEYDEGIHISVHSEDKTRELGTALCKGAGEETSLSYPRGSVQVMFRQYHCCDGEVDYHRSVKRRARTPPAPLTPSTSAEGEESQAEQFSVPSYPNEATSTPAIASASVDQQKTVENVTVKEQEMEAGNLDSPNGMMSKTPSPCLQDESPKEEEEEEKEEEKEEKEEVGGTLPGVVSEDAAKEAQRLAEMEEKIAAEIQEQAQKCEDEGKVQPRVQAHGEAVEAEDRVIEAEQHAADEEKLLVEAYSCVNDIFAEEFKEKEAAARSRQELALARKAAAEKRKANSIELKNKAEEDLAKLIAAADTASLAAQEAQKKAEDTERLAANARDEHPTDAATYELLTKAADLYQEMAEKETECARANRLLAENLMDASQPTEAAEEAERLAEEAAQFAQDLRPAPRDVEGEKEKEKKEKEEKEKEEKKEAEGAEKAAKGPKRESRKSKSAEEGGGCLC